MTVADAGSRDAGSDVSTVLPHRDMRRSAFADGDAADAVFAEVDAHAFAQTDAFTDSEPHALSFDSVSPADHYMVFRGLTCPIRVQFANTIFIVTIDRRHGHWFELLRDRAFHLKTAPELHAVPIQAVSAPSLKKINRV